MHEFKLQGVQGLSADQIARRDAVEGIAHDWMPDIGHVDPDLMSPSRLETDGQGGGVIFLLVGQLRVMSNSPLSVLRIDASLHQGGRLPGDGKIDGSLRRIEAAVHYGKVRAADPALFHLLVQDGGTCHVFSDDHKTAGIAVKAVHAAVDERNPLRLIVGNDAVAERVLIMAQRWLDREIGRLVDDKYILVLMDDVQVHGGRNYCFGRDLICEDRGESISRKNGLIGKDRFIVEQKRVIMVTQVGEQMSREASSAQEFTGSRSSACRPFVLFDYVSYLSSHEGILSETGHEWNCMQTEEGRRLITVSRDVRKVSCILWKIKSM